MRLFWYCFFRSHPVYWLRAAKTNRGGISIPEIIISIRNKLPTVIGLQKHIVADNTDYTARFQYDSEWGSGLKTYFFVLSDGTQLTPVISETNEILLPRLTVCSNASLFIGVQQGTVVTTQPCRIPVFPAITSMLSDPPVPPPEPGVYEQILALINQLPDALRAAENAAVSESEASDSATSAAEAASLAQVSARTAQEEIGRMAFVTLNINVAGHLIAENAQRLGTTSFNLLDNGHMEVTINGN